ncbi:hypothetical protein [Pleurocapsa sp. PCC 7319]|uniref:hypothetical protein n=1 Tax=Pleurocapsa sp. PCC 7319 TaxID=118161 RepID=UPI00034D4BDB|nr:hypothetical protein [Pleurocapsa sp. PCC 7319]
MVSLRKKVTNILVDNPPPNSWLIWVLENSESYLALPGKTDYYNHSCLRLILAQEQIPEGEAFVDGFRMGNDPNTNWIHIQIFKFFARYIYPPKYQLTPQNFKVFDIGFNYGKSLYIKKINCLNFREFDNLTINEIRHFLGISLNDLILIKKLIRLHQNNQHSKNTRSLEAEILRWSSSLFAVVGGFILALNLTISAYGFILLAASSLQLLISSCMQQDKSLIIYSGSIFICVDILAIYRWVLS